MSRRGDNIRKRKDGRWEGRYISSRNSSGKAVYHSVYGKTYSEVKDKLAKESNKTKQKNVDSNNQTVNSVAQAWLIDVRAYKKHSTYVKYEYIYNSHIKQYLGDKKIINIKVDDCLSLIESEYLNSETNMNKLSRSMLNSIRNVLTQIMKYGNNPIEFSINTNILQSCDSFHSKKIDVFSKEEQQKLQNYLLNDIDGYKLGIYVCMFTGLRLGEICALRIDNIDLSKRIITVTQTAQRIKSKNSDSKTELLVSKPKTVNSNRIIPICDVLYSILKEHMSNNTYLVKGSSVMEPRTYQYFFRKILGLLSIDEKNFHSLRHTFATNCIDSGMEPKCLSEILGHSDVKITLNRYVHPSFEQKMNQINSFALDYGQISGQI